MPKTCQGIIFGQQDYYRPRLAALVVCRKPGPLMGRRQFDFEAFRLQLVRQGFRSEEFIVGYFRLRMDSQRDILVDFTVFFRKSSCFFLEICHDYLRYFSPAASFSSSIVVYFFE